uniref:Protein TILLER ANGLE CONTROL 1 n=1 Tax=Kalanchoe fedtschenkoi TaxID=63787 RepID=A0A7N0RB98_KALFE
MKIFNWVHQKLNGQPSRASTLHHPKGEVRMIKLEAPREERSMAKSGDSADTQALLGWTTDGLLAIGTLGCTPHPGFTLGPNFSFRKTNAVFDLDDGNSSDEVFQDATMLMEEMLLGEEDENPLMFNIYNNHEIEEEDEKTVIVAIKSEEYAGGVVKEISVKADRTTLADLFKADSSDPAIDKKCIGHRSAISILKENNGKLGKLKKFPTSISARLVKKLIPIHDAQPIKKLNHMMRKMMKRKIHPEILRQKSSAGRMENQVMPSFNEMEATEGTAALLASVVGS